jgi:sulfur-carrier protein
MIRVALPFHLRNLAGVEGDVELDVAEPVTITSILDALEAKHPTLTGTVRDHTSKERRAFVRFFACERDISFEPADTPLPPEVIEGREAFRVVGALSGG